MRALLTIEAGQGEPRTRELNPEQTFTLGRQRKSGMVLRDEHASRLHAEVFFDDGRWFIRDTGTLNGTRVNGSPIDQPVPLQDGSVIGIGRTAVRFSLESPADGKATLADFAGSATVYPPLLELDQTVLCQDELTVLCQFMAESVKATDARMLIQKGLETLHAQVGAAVTGFLSLDRDNPLPKIVLPDLTRVDIQLSRRLTQAVQDLGRSVWLGVEAELAQESDSLVSFTDALCVPLQAGESALGAVHVYQAARPFSEREVRFCEVLVGHLANSLNVLRVQRKLEAENSRLRSQAPGTDQLIGKSSALQDLRHTIARLAPAPSTILIVGESGAGKELVALALHRQSPRCEGPLVSVNCAAIAPALLESELFGHCRGAFSGADHAHAGYFQQADEGTLFLDEVGELSLECQAKLLRILEGKAFRPLGAEAEIQVDVRVIAATHRDLERDVRDGRFRHDLYFRLQGLQIRVPALREHSEDISELAQSFLERLALVWGRLARLSPEALHALRAYPWPGNVRQLRSVLENAVALGDKEILDVADLRLSAVACSEELMSFNLEQLEAGAVRRALRHSKSNMAQAARLLGVARETLRNLMKKYKIDKEE